MNNDQQFQQNIQTGSGLTRYRSAPSSYFSSLLNDAGFGPSDDFDHHFNPRASSPETQRIFSRFMNGADSIQENCSQSHIDNDNDSQFIQYAKHEPEAQQLQRQQSNEYSSSTQVIYQVHNSDQASNSGAMDNSYNRQMGSFNTNPGPQMKIEGGSNSSLIRHRSSPAGLFANIDIENESNREGLFSSASKFKSQIDFSSRIMDPISEIENKGIGENNPGDGDYISGYQMNSWDDSSFLPDNFLNNEDKSFQNASSSDDQNNEGGNRSKTLLSHHLSLPKSAMEKLMQDSVPCKIRAKRGFATHPRSIAERVRRTKISERMRKLQELVPNMDKQTNTSDMLDLAVDYIKDLQRQVNTLSDKRSNCSCSAQHKS